MEVVKTSLIGKELCSPDIIYIPNSNNQRFLGEYPWHPCYDNLEEWIEDEDSDRFKIPCKYHVPLFEYSWSTGKFSQMSDERSIYYTPDIEVYFDYDFPKEKYTYELWYPVVKE